MDPRSVLFIADACAGEILSGRPETEVRRVCTDSRSVQAGDLFVALAGERFNGHDFLREVMLKAAAVLVEKGRARPVENKCAVIGVDDTRKALGLLAARYRKDYRGAMIAIGGSNGKTTTKELVAAVLRQKLNTVWSEASFNNDIGVPLTLLRLNAEHQVGVLEAGTNHPGELAPLVRMIGPDYGVITNIGREHLEFFGDIAGVAKEEGSLAELVPANGKLFLNGDGGWGDVLARRSGAAAVRVGFNEGNQWRARQCRLDRQGLTFQVDAALPKWSGEYRINLLGRHQAVNALFAIALGCELGLERAQVEQGLAECQPARMRMQFWEFNGVRVLDDAYNANVDSMVAALQTMKDLPCKGRRVAVLGEMAELGAHSEAAHVEVGRRAAELGVGQLFAVGRMASNLARGAREGGLARVLEFGDLETAAAAVKQFVKEGDVLLLKGSRSARLERVVDFLRGGELRKNGAESPRAK